MCIAGFSITEKIPKRSILQLSPLRFTLSNTVTASSPVITAQTSARPAAVRSGVPRTGAKLFSFVLLIPAREPGGCARTPATPVFPSTWHTPDRCPATGMPISRPTDTLPIYRQEAPAPCRQQKECLTESLQPPHHPRTGEMKPTTLTPSFPTHARKRSQREA